VTKDSFVYLLKIYKPINTRKLNIKDFKLRFKKAPVISLEDIVQFYKVFENKVKKSTVKWRVHALVEKGIIQRIGRGKYRLGKHKEFEPYISEDNTKLYQELKLEFPFLDICIWSTQWIGQWMLHVPGTFETIIEVEKDSEENVFYFVSELRSNVFIHPEREIINRYAKSNEPIIIIKNLVTGSPLQINNDVQIPTIEKIIVNLIVNKELFSTYQGRDLDSILTNAFEYNTINEDKLFRYAQRRKKGVEVERLIHRIKNR